MNILTNIEQSSIRHPLREDAPLSYSPTTRLIGSILVGAGKLNEGDIDMVLREADQSNIRFGEAALRLRLISAEDLRFGLASQYSFPYVDPHDPALAQRLPVAFNPDSPFAESLRSIRSRIVDEWPSRPGMARVVTVGSVDHQDGRSFVASNLAVAFAQMGGRTLVIDADLRRPSQHRMFSVAGGLGLAGILSGRAGIEEIMHFTGLDNLSLLQAGPPVPNPQELLSRESFDDLLESLAAKFDAIVIDTPAAKSSSDMQIAARRSDGALLVVRRDRSRSAELQQLARYLQHAKVRVATVINHH